MTLQVRTKGLRELRKRMADTGDRMRRLGPATKVAAEELRTAIVRESFGKERGLNDEAWAPLAESTIRRRRGSSAVPLQDTGQLKQSTTTRGTDQSVIFGVSGAPARYARPHQFGTRTIPRRPFLPTDDRGRPTFRTGAARKWFEKFVRRITRYITEGKV